MRGTSDSECVQVLVRGTSDSVIVRGTSDSVIVRGTSDSERVQV